MNKNKNTHGYLITHGDVYDGSGSAPSAVDVRIRGGQIVEIAPELSAAGDEVIDATGLLVTPGLIDLHVHVYAGMGVFSVEPAEAGLRTGVTTMLDTGTAGMLTYAGFRQHVIDRAEEDVFVLLNISMIGCLHAHTEEPYVSDLLDSRLCHAPSALKCVEANRDRIIGTKVRMTGAIADNKIENERAGLRGAVEVARKAGVFCMVHHSLSLVPLDEVIDALAPGDVITHLYHPNPDHGFDDDGRPRDAIRRARDKGIILDVGHGVGSFDWSIAEPACRTHDFWPDTISTDLHQFNKAGPVFDMATTMSKFLHLGMPLEQVIAASTHKPAAAMRLDDRFGLLAPGRQADVAILALEDTSRSLVDVVGASRQASRMLVVKDTFKRGRRFQR